MGARHGEEPLLLMAMAVTAGSARPPPAASAAATLHPRLLMAARRGDSKELEKLIKYGDERAATVEASPQQHGDAFVLEVDGRRPPAAPSSGAAASPPLLLDGVTLEGDSLLHVVAACGDGKEKKFEDCAEMICGVDKLKHLLEARNNKGDTPLHCAAAAGNAGMISCLVNLCRKKAGAAAGDDPAVKRFLRIRNHRGETALHQALRATSNPLVDRDTIKACIDKLLLEDPMLAYFPNEKDEGDTTSPLYLAISLGEMKIARYLFFQSKNWLSYSGPDGRNVLHVAVSRGKALQKLLKWFEKDVLVKRDSACLLSSLTNQRDKAGSTPLHLAASMEGWPLATDLSKWFPHVWPQSNSTIKALLDINQCPAYQPDKEGLYPIHVAASVGSLESVKALLDKCPDCETLCDGKGRTFLHVAVEKEMRKVVKYVCRMLKFSSVLNMQDSNGDTALHRAISVGDLAIFNCLIQNPHVRLDIPNKDELTPLDLSRSKILPKFYSTANPRYAIHSSLQYVGAPCGGSRADIFHKKYAPKRNEEKESENLTSATQIAGITSVVVATMAFAGAFTFPGGYYQSANDGVPGAPVLGGSYAFDAFVIANGLTFACSCVATFSLIFSGLPSMDLSLRYKYFHRSIDFLEYSVRSLPAAFVMGLYLLLAPVSRTLVILVFVCFVLSLLYGQVSALMVIRVANTARIRSAIGTKTSWAHLVRFSKTGLLPCWSFVLIFGIPLASRLIKVYHTH